MGKTKQKHLVILFHVKKKQHTCIYWSEPFEKTAKMESLLPITFLVDLWLEKNDSKSRWDNDDDDNDGLKVIPLFCTAHPLLRITLRHPRWRRFSPLRAQKEQTRAAFARLKLLFAIIMPQIVLQLPGLLWKTRTARPVVELLKRPGWGFGLWGLWSLWDSSTSLQLH